MKIDYRYETDWEVTRAWFPVPLETVYTDEPWRSDAIIEYSGWFEQLESKRVTIRQRRITLWRRIGSNWDYDTSVGPKPGQRPPPPPPIRVVKKAKTK